MKSNEVKFGNKVWTTKLYAYRRVHKFPRSQREVLFISFWYFQKGKEWKVMGEEVKSLWTEDVCFVNEERWLGIKVKNNEDKFGNKVCTTRIRIQTSSQVPTFPCSQIYIFTVLHLKKETKKSQFYKVGIFIYD